MEEKTALLATFVKSGFVRHTIKEIASNFRVVNDKIFLLKDRRYKSKYIVTFNVFVEDDMKYSGLVDNTISLHRKKETNTLYTLNALNEVVKQQNDGQLDDRFPVDWNEFKNCVLITKKVQTESGEEVALRKIETKLVAIIDATEFQHSSAQYEEYDEEAEADEFESEYEYDEYEDEEG